MLRTSTYSVKGDAEKLNEMTASDGGMIQSQKDIDKKYSEKKMSDASSEEKAPENNEQQTPPDEKKKGKATFWIFVVLGVLMALIFITTGFSVWFLLAIIMWFFFLRYTWKTLGAAFSFGKVIGFGIGVILVSFIFIDAALPSAEEAREEYDETMAAFDESKTNDNTKMSPEDMAQAGEKIKDDTTDSVDTISAFLMELEKETDIDFGPINPDKVTWSAGDIALGLTDGRSFGAENLDAKDFDAIEKFFLVDYNSNTGGLGFEFVPPAGTQSAGFVVGEQGKYQGLMCVMGAMENDGIFVGCGWGPGGPN